MESQNNWQTISKHMVKHFNVNCFVIDVILSSFIWWKRIVFDGHVEEHDSDKNQN